MKVLFVLEYYHPHVGGVEKLFKTLAEALAERGNEIMVITNRFDPELKSDDNINGVQVKRLNLRNRFFFSFFSIGSILKHARNYDFIHTTSYNAALPAGIAAKILRKNVIITFHEVWGKLWFKLPFLNFIQKTLFYLFEKLILHLPYYKFIAVSDTTRQRLIEHGIKKQKILRIYNGIDYPTIPQEKAMQGKEFTFTFLGRLGVSKGLDLLIPAASRFMIDYPDSKFQMITPSKPMGLCKRIKKRLKQYGIVDQVIWLKNASHDEIEDGLSNSHCMVIPSYSEGFCFVAAEAASRGIPIISSDKAALKEVVSGEFIKMSELSSAAIHQALIEARDGNFEKSKLEKFEFNSTLEEYLKLYNSML